MKNVKLFSRTLKDRNPEQRIHINLSAYTWDTLTHDYHRFREGLLIEKKPNKLNKTPMSTIINIAIQNFREIAKSSLFIHEKERKKQFQELLTGSDGVLKELERKKNFDAEEIKELGRFMIDQLMKYHQEDLYTLIPQEPKYHQFKLRVNKSNFEFLEKYEDEIYEYYSTFSSYLKAVLEEYSKRSVIEREQIFFKDRIDTIQAAINTNRVLSIVLQNNHKYQVTPYNLFVDGHSTFNYLVGFSKYLSNNSVTSASIASFRISRIQKISYLNYNDKLTDQQIKEINDRIERKGVPFLAGEPKTIQVKLSKKGLDKYKNHLFLRPNYKEKLENEPIYVFDCTEKQIEFYFLKFGEDALVLEPVELKEKFKEFYQKALEKYQQ